MLDVTLHENHPRYEQPQVEHVWVFVRRALGGRTDPGDQYSRVMQELRDAMMRSALDELDRPVVSEERTHRPSDRKTTPPDRRHLREAGLGAHERQGQRTCAIDRTLVDRRHSATTLRDAACVAAR